MKKTIATLLTLITIFCACAFIPTASMAEALPMYVYTENGNRLNVRSSPNTGKNVIGKLNYGQKVMVEFINSSGWAVILYNKGTNGEAYVQARFLRDTKPAPKKKSATNKEQTDQAKEQKKLNNELKSETEVQVPYYIAVRPTRASGWVNFRVGPAQITSRIASFPDGKQLIVLGETTNWYRARDPETQKIGYISKKQTQVINNFAFTTTTNTDAGVEKLGSLSVNGEFDLTCRLPADYQLQVVNRQGASIIASVLSEDMTKPQLYLSIAFDETYSEVERMNDLTADQLAVLEESFSEMNDVNISYSETGHGTKLLIARETGADTDFVDILAIYKGYFIEFNMTPNPKAVNQTLTDEQIKMCIDFLTDVDFTPVQ